jgi:hypothetical protein
MVTAVGNAACVAALVAAAARSTTTQSAHGGLLHMKERAPYSNQWEVLCLTTPRHDIVDTVLTPKAA